MEDAVFAFKFLEKCRKLMPCFAGSRRGAWFMIALWVVSQRNFWVCVLVGKRRKGKESSSLES